METSGRLAGVSRTVDGKLIVSFQVDERKTTLEGLNALEGADLDIEAKKHRNKRSLDSNRYLWQLCDKIAKKVGYDREHVYVMMLERYGRFEDVSIYTEAVPEFRRHLKYTEERYSGDGWTVVRVYYGSSGYNTEEMSELIDGVVQEAEDLGIETKTPDEIAHMKAMWEAQYG